LGDPRCKLVISHATGDEGSDYPQQIVDLARFQGVDVRFFGDRIGDKRHLNGSGRKIYVLQDLYQHADLVLYPSIYEGFGNAFLEALYYQVPIIVNRYPVWVRDIEPRGFKVPVMNGFVSRDIVVQARRLLDNPDYRHEMVRHNYELARKYYSYPVLRQGLITLINNIKNRM